MGLSTQTRMIVRGKYFGVVDGLFDISFLDFISVEASLNMGPAFSGSERLPKTSLQWGFKRLYVYYSQLARRGVLSVMLIVA